ncbi:hypothetical protein [Paraburkholderia hospita]|nr:hypothetical protein [Paraburkholderia hospita]
MNLLYEAGGDNVSGLAHHRAVLLKQLSSSGPTSWNELKPAIENWWTSYKEWEAKDEFNLAYQRARMSVRTFDNNFESNKNRRLGLDAGVLNLGYKGLDNRFFADSSYGSLGDRCEEVGKRFQAQEAVGRELAKLQGTSAKSGAYWADRGIDSKAFANPANFVNREAKYDAGLHDLSASLLNPELSIFEQVHHKTEQGAHFAFVPLSEPEDQRVLFMLIQMAKVMRQHWPEMYALIMQYRGRMTRVKLAQCFDMGAGYIAIPVSNPVPGGRQFKLRYGLVSQMSVLAPSITPAATQASTRVSNAPPPPSKPYKGIAKPVNLDERNVKVTPEIYHARQQAALDFRSILVRKDKNEIVIALRQHAGNFPVYAQRVNNVLKCYRIVKGGQVWTGRTISERGIMTW